MVSHWSLSVSESPQVSRTFLSILANLNNAVVRMVSTCPLISKSSSPFTNPLEIVLSAQTTIGTTFTFMFHCFFCSLVRSWYLFLFSFSFFLFVVQQDVKVHYSAGSLFFLLPITSSGHLGEIQ